MRVRAGSAGAPGLSLLPGSASGAWRCACVRRPLPFRWGCRCQEEAAGQWPLPPSLAGSARSGWLRRRLRLRREAAGYGRGAAALGAAAVVDLRSSPVASPSERRARPRHEPGPARRRWRKSRPRRYGSEEQGETLPGLWLKRGGGGGSGIWVCSLRGIRLAWRRRHNRRERPAFRALGGLWRVCSEGNNRGEWIVGGVI